MDEVVVASDQDNVYENTRPSCSSKSPKEFHPGDHVWMWCETIGGIRYQHHAIVMRASSSSEGKQTITIADFTAPDEATFALPTSSASNVTSTSGNTAQESSDGTKDGGVSASAHGIRVTACNSDEWYKEEYGCSDDDDENIDNTCDPPERVLQRVNFLIQRPDLLPKYELLESNCECVAVWCKTGKFRTHQVAGLFNGGKRNSAVVTGTAVAASLLGFAPIAVGVVGAGVWSFVSQKHSSNESKWSDQTNILNEEFQKWLEEEQSGPCIIL